MMRERASLERELYELGLSPGVAVSAPLTDKQIARAVRANRGYARTIGWSADHDRIVRLLGYTDQTPDERRLAVAVARWQQSSGLGVDGIIGPRTWERLRAQLNGTTPARPSPAVNSRGTTPAGPFGTLVFERPGRPPFRYQFTPEDVLWTARLVTGEAGGGDDDDNKAVIWSMFNRYAIFMHRYHRSFHRFLRAYSTTLQPVLKNPGAARRHAHKPEFVKTDGMYDPPDDNVPKGQLRRHLDLQRMPWERLPASARSLAERALKGEVPNLIGNATEFASTRVYFHDRNGRYPNDDEWRRFTARYARGKNWTWIGDVVGLNQKKNAYFVADNVARMAGAVVRVEPPG